MSVTTESNGAIVFDWQRWPETEAIVGGWIASGLHGNEFAATLAVRMRDEASTRFVDWVDHLVLAGGSGLIRTLEGIGYRRQKELAPSGRPAFAHSGGIFPRIIVVPGETIAVQEIAIKVESIADFSRAHDLGLTILGYALGPYRVARVSSGSTSLSAVERRGYTGFDPFPGDLAREGRMRPHAARDALAARDL
ncbi:hypothetical protein ACYOEI_23160, partial [Singulisphaera rosea]